jgi:nitrate reductase NapE component
MLARSPWHKALAVLIIVLVPILAIAVPAWCFGTGMW